MNLAYTYFQLRYWHFCEVTVTFALIEIKVSLLEVTCIYNQAMSVCCIFLAGLYKNGQLAEHPDCKPWVEDSYWDIKRSNNAIIEEAYKQFNGKAPYVPQNYILYYKCVRR